MKLKFAPPVCGRPHTSLVWDAYLSSAKLGEFVVLCVLLRYHRAAE